MSGNTGKGSRRLLQFLQNIKNGKLTDIGARFHKRTWFVKGFSALCTYKSSSMIEDGTFSKLQSRMVDFPQLVLFDFQGRRTTYGTGCLLSFKDYINEERVFFVVRGNRLNFLLGNVQNIHYNIIGDNDHSFR